MKKKVSKTAADVTHNIKTAQNIKKETAGIVHKEKKMSEKWRTYAEVNEEKKHLHSRKGQNSGGLVKDTFKKQGSVDCIPQLHLSQDVQMKKLKHHSDLWHEHSASDCPGSVKKLKLCDNGRKLDEICGEVKLYADDLVEGQKKGNDEQLHHDIKKEQLVERHQRADKQVDRKLNIVGTSTEMRAGRSDVDMHSTAGNSEHITYSARQHVRRGLYRALSSR